LTLPCFLADASSLALVAEKQNAHAQKFGESIKDVKFSPDGTKIVSCGVDQTIKVWDAATPHLKTEKANAFLLDLLQGSPSLNLLTEKANAHSGTILSVDFSPDGSKIVSGSSDKTIKVWDAESLTMVEERWGDAATIDKPEEVAERDGATLRLKEGGAFYAPSPLVSVAVHWPRLVAGAQSGELYDLEVQE